MFNIHFFYNRKDTSLWLPILNITGFFIMSPDTKGSQSSDIPHVQPAGHLQMHENPGA